jgi:hypothetical protein
MSSTAAFSPSSLFAASEPGVWYDPSDLTTLFTDTAGTTPVTATGQTVARINDKSGRGNHATQATTASRPTYGINPITGTRNLLLATDTMATQSRTVTAAAHTLSFTGTGTVTLTGASTAGPLVGTGAGNRVSLTFTPTAASLTMTVSGSVTFAQLELGSTATAYQRVTDQYNVTEAGVASAHYLFFDGGDDFMSSSNITWPGPYAVWAGILTRKVTGVQSIADADPSGGTRTPQFLRINNATPDTINFSSSGVPYDSGPAVSINTNTVLSASSTATQIDVRRNAVSDGPSASTGTLNTATRAVFIGRYFTSNTQLFFGNMYSVIIRGASTDATQISNTETYVAGKTGVTL